MSVDLTKVEETGDGIATSTDEVKEEVAGFKRQIDKLIMPLEEMSVCEKLKGTTRETEMSVDEPMQKGDELKTKLDKSTQSMKKLAIEGMCEDLRDLNTIERFMYLTKLSQFRKKY